MGRRKKKKTKYLEPIPATLDEHIILFSDDIALRLLKKPNWYYLWYEYFLSFFYKNDKNIN